MKYAIFIISALFFAGEMLSIYNMHIRYTTLTHYGYGYLTGTAVLLLLFLVLMFFSGRKIYRQLKG